MLLFRFVDSGRSRLPSNVIDSRLSAQLRDVVLRIGAVGIARRILRSVLSDVTRVSC
jgi:hypothetical protein